MATIYRVDRADTIVSVNGEWSEFARANEAPELAGSAVIGRSLWDYVRGAELRLLHGEILRQARAGRALAFPFRCDGPAVRRRMHMRVTLELNGTVVYEAQLDAAEPRAPQPLFDRSAARSGDFVRVCSWCKRVAVGDRWEEIEIAVSALALFERTPVQPITHGLCGGCAEEVMRDLGV